MLKFLTKTTPFMLASLLATTAGFALDNTRGQKKGFDQGLEMPANQTLAAHSYPARQEVRGSWDVQTNLSYILWQASQENMDVGILSNNFSPLLYPSASTVKHADFDYKSGFKVGLGLNLDYDNWNVYSEYTWFHGTSHTNVSAEAGQFLFPSQGLQVSSDSYTPFSSAKQAWNLKMDFADLSLSRSFYSGTKFTLNPFVGARGAWIRQSLNTTYVDTVTLPSTLTVGQGTVSQGIGPRTGVDSNWLLGYGLRLSGKAAADILYTRYHYSLNQKLDYASEVTSDISTQVNEKHNGFLRTHADLELGLGWGSYFDNNNWYFDLSADYGFQAFWGQNMFRSFASASGLGQTVAPNGDLFIHGLTLTARLDY